VELAEVSLWLNAIYGEQDEEKAPRPARVPWFGYQLFAGNSLIGARPEVYVAGLTTAKANPKWHEQAPRRLDPQKPDRRPDEIYHFLLPDPGMADYKDKTAKALYPTEFERLKKWRTEDPLPLWPDSTSLALSATGTAKKDEIRRQGLWNRDEDEATPFRRLKLVLDYWCALWFWPIQPEVPLPSREEWW
jgi:hypothetical protein